MRTATKLTISLFRLRIGCAARYIFTGTTTAKPPMAGTRRSEAQTRISMFVMWEVPQRIVVHQYTMKARLTTRGRPSQQDKAICSSNSSSNNNNKIGELDILVCLDNDRCPIYRQLECLDQITPISDEPFPTGVHGSLQGHPLHSNCTRQAYPTAMIKTPYFPTINGTFSET